PHRLPLLLRCERGQNRRRGKAGKSKGEERHMTAESGPLTGQVAVVTGAGRGIGSAIAARLASLGATTILCGRTRPNLQNTAGAIASNGGRAAVAECDVTDLKSIEALAAYV